RCSPLCRQGGRFGFQRYPQLEDIDHLLDQVEAVLVVADGFGGCLQDEGPDALLGDDQSGGAQRGDSLAYHRTAHPELVYELLLARQLVAWLEGAFGYPLRQGPAQLRGQGFASAQCRHWLSSHSVPTTTTSIPLLV